MSTAALAPKMRRRDGRRAVAGGGILLGVSLGLFVVFAGSQPLAWFTYLMVAGIGGCILLTVQHPRRFVLGLLVFSFQANANVYLFHRDSGSGWAGSSGPSSIQLSLCAMVALILLMMIGLGIDTTKKLRAPQEVLKPALMYLGAVVLSGILTPEHYLWFCYIMQQLFLICVMLAITNAIQDESDFQLAVRILLLTTTVQSLAYFGEAALGTSFSLEGHSAEFEGAKAHGGTIGTHSNLFAAFMTPLVLLALARFVGGLRTGKWLMSGVALFLGGSAILASGSRASWMAAAIGGAIILYLAWQRGMIQGRHIAGAVTLVLLVAAASAPLLLDRLDANHSRDYEERKALMRMAINVWKHNPIFGCGAGAYASVFRNYLTPDLAERWLYVVHNRYLLVAAELGTLGLLALLAFYRVWLRVTWRLLNAQSQDKQMLGLGLLGGVVALLWHQYWEPLFGFPIDGLIYALVGLAGAADRLETARVAETAPIPSAT